MQTRKCSVCKTIKPVNEFNSCIRKSGRKKGKPMTDSACRLCANEKSKTWRNENKEDYLLYLKKWREENEKYRKEYARKRYYSNVDRTKNQRLKRYGLDLEKYNTILSLQNYNCEICKCPFNLSDGPHGKGAPNVDHCHKTKKTRGIICNFCNKGLGLFKDNILSLQSAIQYLTKHNGES